MSRLMCLGLLLGLHAAGLVYGAFRPLRLEMGPARAVRTVRCCAVFGAVYEPTEPRFIRVSVET